MKEKVRLDQYLCDKGLLPSREKAKAVIMAGQVYVGNQKAEKAGMLVKPEDVVEVRGRTMPYVSRGGLKLEKALAVFPVSPEGKVAMDVGASTGGFTDCMLQNGAVRVYAVDVGYGQLAWSLRSDARVVNLERTNVRYLSAEQVPEPIAFASVDVSFISLTVVLPAFYAFLEEGAQVICLVKPQFEAGRENVGKKGVVRDPVVHAQVCERIIGFCAENGFLVRGIDYSPVKGPEGNIEYLLFLEKRSDAASGANAAEWSEAARAAVERSHRELG